MNTSSDASSGVGNDLASAFESQGLGYISFCTLSRFAIVLASRSPWPDFIPGGGKRGEFLDPFFLPRRGRICGTSESDQLISNDARIWACRAREVLVGLGILIGQARNFNCGSSSSPEASQSGNLEEKAVSHWCRNS